MPHAPHKPPRPDRAQAAGTEADPAGRRAVLGRPRRFEQPNMTPMIDVVFNLLIFFLCTGNFSQPEGLLPSRLPRHHGLVAGEELPLTPIRVVLKQYGPGEEDYTIRVEQRAERPNDFAALAEILRGLRESPAFDSESQIIVLADGSVRWDHLVNAFNAAVVARFKNITFGTK